jgi:hypothetical protein
MGCSSCGGRKRGEPKPDTRNLKSGLPGPAALPSGMYPLAASNGCSEPYHGKYKRANVYVIGQLSEGEKIFRRSAGKEATAYAREKDLSIRGYLAANLCHDTMVEFFGA